MRDPQLTEVSDFRPKQTSRAKSILREILETLILTAVIFFLVNTVTGRFKIYGASMDNTFHNGEYIIVSRLAYQFGEPQRGDVVVFVPPGHPEATFTERLLGIPGETDFIKRIVGLPGDVVKIENGQVLVNGVALNEPYIKEPMFSYQSQEWALGLNQYFALGDNRNFSKDSRDPAVGPIEGSRIVGKVWVVYWPMSDWKVVEHYQYP